MVAMEPFVTFVVNSRSFKLLLYFLFGITTLVRGIDGSEGLATPLPGSYFVATENRTTFTTTFSSSGLDLDRKIAVGVCTVISAGILGVGLVILAKFINRKLKLARNNDRENSSNFWDNENPAVTNQGFSDDLEDSSLSRLRWDASESNDDVDILEINLGRDNRDQSRKNEGCREALNIDSIPTLEVEGIPKYKHQPQKKRSTISHTHRKAGSSTDSGYGGSIERQSKILDVVSFTDIQETTRIDDIQETTRLDDIQETTYRGSPKDAKSRKERKGEKGLSTKSAKAKKIITVRGDILEVNDVSLRVEEGCLSKDTEITMILGDQDIFFQRLCEFGILKVDPLLIEFRPDGLEFLKPALLTAPFKPDPPTELFVLHGTFRDNEREQINWKVMPIDDFDYSEKGYVRFGITSFCFICYIMACKGVVARIISHLNHSFNCYAIALYRRMSPSEIDIAVVLLSEYVKNNKSELEKSDLMIKLCDNKYKYRLAEQGTSKLLDTHGCLRMRLELSGIDPGRRTEIQLDQSKLDSLGMVVDKFLGILQEFPAKGKVHIAKVGGDNLWSLNIVEEREYEADKITEEIPNPPDDLEAVAPSNAVVRRQRLSVNQIARMSRNMPMDWDSLAGLMDIPYVERESIKLNNNYPEPENKAEKVITMINEKPDFSLDALEKCFTEMQRDDLWKASGLQEHIRELKNEEAAKNNSSDMQKDSEVSNSTPLSPREMYRISRSIAKEWPCLAGLLSISVGERDGINISHNLYPDPKSKAEKTLSLYNSRNTFSRNELATYLKEIRLHDLSDKVKLGSLRAL